ncbi:CPBP family intramembrane metalloprotease [Leucobacter zeae]|nr:CPBP family intramembrane metalloprotease [Leucobacter zeae]
MVGPEEYRESLGWTRFWNRGAWWKALLAAVVYLVLYEGTSLLVGLAWGGEVDPNPFANARSVFLGLLLPLVVGAVLLFVFVATLRWLPELFGRQPIRGGRWMWVAVVVTLVPVGLRLFGIDYGSYAAGVVPLTFVAGLFIGFTEELLTRGIAVKLLRDAGHGEWAVAMISSALFALLHAVNLLGGQPIVTVAATVGFAFAFGVLMYLVLRATGSLVWPMLIHGLTDPTTFLSTGGVDVVARGEQGTLLQLAAPFNIVFMLLALGAICCIRGRVGAQGAEVSRRYDGMHAAE